MNAPQLIADWTDSFVISKPSQWHSLRGKDTKSPNLQDWLEEEYPSQKFVEESGLCNRLDFQTSGCVLCAREESARDLWRKRFGEFELAKLYLAIVEGQLASGSKLAYLRGRYRSSKKLQVLEEGKEQERAEIRWSKIEESENLSLLQVEILGPGRRHQIRALLASTGHPVQGDELYGASRAAQFGLHAWKLAWGNLLAVCPPGDAFLERFKKLPS